MVASTLVDLVKVYAVSTGTGAMTLGQAVPGYRGVEALANGAVYSYSIQQNAEYETGKGTYLLSGKQLVRTPGMSSNGGTAINIQAGTEVAFVALAEDILARDVLQPLYGYGAPLVGQGLTGQVYYDLNKPVTLYGPKTASGWGMGVVLQGDAGTPNTYSSLAAFKASDPAKLNASLVGVPGIPDGSYGFTSGDFTARIDNLNFIKANAVSAGTGAWVRATPATTFDFNSLPSVKAAGTGVLDVSGLTRGKLIADPFVTNGQAAAHPLAIVKTLDNAYLRRDPRELMPDALGADASGTSDSSAAIQASIDYQQAFCEVRGVGEGTHPILLTGQYRCNTTLIRRSADLIGRSSALQGATLIWGGTPGGTLLRESSDPTPGGVSFGSVQNLFFSGGLSGHEPACLYDLSTAYAFGIDILFQLWRCGFDTASDCLVRTAGLTNLHWQHLRFDNAGNFAVDTTIPSGDSARSWAISNFTYDSKGRGQGLHKISIATGSSAGVIEWNRGRIELNNAPWSGAKAIFAVNNNNQYLNAMLALTSVTVANDSPSLPGAPFYFVNQTGASQPVFFDGTRMVLTSPTAWTGATGVPGYQYVPPVRSQMAKYQIGTMNGDTTSYFADLVGGRIGAPLYSVGGSMLSQWPNDAGGAAGRIQTDVGLIPNGVPVPATATTPGRYGNTAWKDNGDGTAYHYVWVTDNLVARSGPDGYRTDWTA